MAARRVAADRIARKGKGPSAAHGKTAPAELHPVVKRLILHRPNFRRGWQLAQMAPVPYMHPRTDAEVAGYIAMEAAFVAAGKAGANGNTYHPMRAAWEAMRACLVAAGRIE